MRSTPLPPLMALRQARQHLLEFGQCPSGLLDERLTRSWARSAAAGLAPTGRPQPVGHASSASLRHALARSPALLAHSRPVMEYLFEQVRHSHSVVVLADATGLLLHTLGDPQFVDKAERVALTRGASWHEAHRGTNAIGTALAEGSAIEVHGGEHFLERNGFLTCAAAPIVSATGELLGALDISGDHRNGHAHTLGLVSTAAQLIENRLLLQTCQRHLRLHLHPHPEGLGSVAEGIVALSEDGWIVAANRAALAQLHLSASDVGAVRIEQCLEARLETLRAHQQRRPDQPQSVRAAHGGNLCVQLHLDSHAIAAATRVSPPPPSTSPALRAPVRAAPTQTLPPHAPADALAALDTGDAQWHAACERARRVAGKPIALLLQGASGVGKEVFARAWHASGPRRQGPFVAINCSAIPEHLIEAELFGYVGGAFTGARKQGSPGRLREAHGGTLLLDEIGDMPLALQTRLLRVLQERSVTPVGSGSAHSVDFALICATHCNLLEAAEQGRFRHDLYYRINGLLLQLPALRERTDFAVLTERLLAQLATENALPQPVQIAPDLLARMARHPWPGNLRQYASVLRTACALMPDGDTLLDWPHLPDDVAAALQALPPGTTPPRHSPPLQWPEPGAQAKEWPLSQASTRQVPCGAVPHAASSPIAPAMNLQALSQQATQMAIAQAQGNLSQAARALGISRQTLYRKLSKR